MKSMTAEQGRIVGIAEVSRMTALSEATLRYYRHLGTGPRSFKIGKRVGYYELEVIAWIDEQVEATAVGAPTTVPHLEPLCPNCGVAHITASAPTRGP
jgi:predicted DNA-binding transcriptional regulator AlpA